MPYIDDIRPMDAYEVIGRKQQLHVGKGARKGVNGLAVGHVQTAVHTIGLNKGDVRDVDAYIARAIVEHRGFGSCHSSKQKRLEQEPRGLHHAMLIAGCIDVMPVVG